MKVIYARDWMKEFIKELDFVTSTHVIKIVDRLSVCGNKIEMPFSKSLGNGLFELRVMGKKQVRLIYAFNQDKAYILHIFVKKSWQIPKREIEHARSVYKNLFA